jgi:hypothetical protein
MPFATILFRFRMVHNDIVSKTDFTVGLPVICNFP